MPDAECYTLTCLPASQQKVEELEEENQKLRTTQASVIEPEISEGELLKEKLALVDDLERLLQRNGSEEEIRDIFETYQKSLMPKAVNELRHCLGHIEKLLGGCIRIHMCEPHM